MLPNGMDLKTRSVVGSAPCWAAGKSQSRKQEKLEGPVARGRSPESVLSPLLWSLVVDKLIGGLEGNGYYTLGYADDIVFHTCEKFLNIVSELLQEAFEYGTTVV
jgi:hypothetical protein